MNDQLKAAIERSKAALRQPTPTIVGIKTVGPTWHGVPLPMVQAPVKRAGFWARVWGWLS